MATDEQKYLSDQIKALHKHLRDETRKHGVDHAWNQHTGNRPVLVSYANAMKKLATIWDQNSTNNQLAKSRVQWTIRFCLQYFENQIYITKREREKRLVNNWLKLDETFLQPAYHFIETLPDRLSLLDVGSCFNPFAEVSKFDVTAIDLCPADESVLCGDFLNIPIQQKSESDKNLVCFSENGEAIRLISNSFHCIVFSLLLEYIPCPMKRTECCRKAYDLLIHEGILIIITPDSGHIGKNAPIMKSWQYSLGLMGFIRVCYEKLPHITCLAFRKTISPIIANKWTLEHFTLNEPATTIRIPQDDTN